MKKQNLIWLIPIMGIAILIYASIEAAIYNREISNSNDKQIIKNEAPLKKPQIPQQKSPPRQYKPTAIKSRVKRQVDASITKTKTNVKNVGCPDIGEIGYIQAFHTLAINKQALDELTNISIAQDNTGYENLILSGRAFILPETTQILVIDRSWFIRKVRILEGPYKNQAGWIAYESITKTK